MAMLTKSLEELISEKKVGGSRGKGGRTAGRGGKGGKGAGGRGKSAGRGGRQAGGSFNAMKPATTVARNQPYSQSAGRGRGGGRAVISRQVVKAPQQQNKTRVFVSGVPFDWEEQDVLHVMETAGEVEKLTIFWDPAGRPTGNALVSYRTDQGARQALSELDGAKLGDKEIKVTSARGDGNKGAGRGGAGPVGRGGKSGARGGAKPAKQPQQQQPQQQTRSFGKKGRTGKGGKGRGGKGQGNKSAARVERKEISKEDLDTQLANFTSTD